MVKVNAVGMACPLPVIETRKALRTEDVVETTVDNKIATENLRKMAAELGYTYELKEESADRFVVTVTKTEGEEAVQVPSADKDTDEYIVVIDSPTMGKGDEQLGKNLMKGFIYSLTEQDVLPRRIIFYNGGVPLITKDSEVLEDLQKMAAAGTLRLRCLP